jgi:hypothetical protein
VCREINSVDIDESGVIAPFERATPERRHLAKLGRSSAAPVQQRRKFIVAAVGKSEKDANPSRNIF